MVEFRSFSFDKKGNHAIAPGKRNQEIRIHAYRLESDHPSGVFCTLRLGTDHATAPMSVARGWPRAERTPIDRFASTGPSQIARGLPGRGLSIHLAADVPVRGWVVFERIGATAETPAETPAEQAVSA